MSNKSVKFKIELETGGDKVLHTLSVNAEELRDALKGVKQASETASEKLKDIGSFTLAMNQSMEVIEKLGSAIGSLAEDFNRFDTAMRKANTMAGQNKEGLAALKGEVEGLAESIPLAKDEIANGLYQVISNGVPKDNWIAFLEASSRSAVGGVADLGQTVTVTSTIIKNYGLEWAAAADIQDKIQATAKNGVTSFEQLAQALPRVSGSAAALGVNIDELLGTFATLTGVSGNTAEVSTQLAAVFTALLKPSGEAADMAEQIGVKFDAGAIKAAGGMSNFLTQLDKDIKEFAQGDEDLTKSIYARLFGSAEALRALTPLTGELSQKFSDNIATMADSAGTMDAAFADMAGSGESAMQLLKNKMSTMFDWAGAVASTTQPYITFIAMAGQAAIGLTGLYQTLGLAKAATIAFTTAKWASLKPLIVGIAQTIRHTAVSLAASAAQKGVAIATSAWSAAQAALNLVLEANPIGLVIIAIAALVAGIIYAYNNSEEFRAVCDKLWASVKSLAKMVWDNLVSAFKWVVKVGTDAYNTIKDILGLDGGKAEVKIKVNHSNGGGGSGGSGSGKIPPKQDKLKAIPLIQSTEAKIRELEERAKKATSESQLKRINAELAREKKKLDRYQGLGAPKATTGRGGRHTPPPSKGLIGKMEEKIEAAKKKLREAVSEEGIVALRKEIAGYEKELERLNKVGEVKPTKSLKEEAYTLKDISKNIDYLNEQLQEATPQQAALINTQIKDWEKKADTIRNAGIVDIYDEEADTIQKIAVNIKLLQEELETATLKKAAAINRSIEMWKQKREEIEKAGTDKTINIGAANIDDFEENISTLQNRLKKASIEEAADINRQIKLWEKKKEAIQNAGESVKKGEQLSNGWNSLKSIGSSINSITSALEGNSSAWEKLTAVIDGTISTIQGISAVIGVIKALTAASSAQAAQAPATIAANQAVASSNVGVAATGAMAAHSWMPFVGIALGVAAVATMLATLSSAKSSVPKFAKGGIAYGTTLGIFGEYAGASNNPEVVAPLDRLRSLLDLGNGSGGGKVEFKISGRSLVGVLAKENHRASRNL